MIRWGICFLAVLAVLLGWNLWLDWRDRVHAERVKNAFLDEIEADYQEGRRKAGLPPESLQRIPPGDSGPNSGPDRWFNGFPPAV